MFRAMFYGCRGLTVTHVLAYSIECWFILICKWKTADQSEDEKEKKENVTGLWSLDKTSPKK